MLKNKHNRYENVRLIQMKGFVENEDKRVNENLLSSDERLVNHSFRQKDYSDLVPSSCIAKNEERRLLDDDLDKKKTENQNEERDEYSGKFDYLIIGIGSVVGLGNLWRFPFICYRNGGGVFLVPYICMIILYGLPFTLIETSLGQYSSSGPVTYFSALCPILKGVGYSQAFIPMLTVIPYTVLISWSLDYLIHCLKGELSWTSCKNSYNTENCVVHSVYKSNESYLQNQSSVNFTLKTSISKGASSSEEFFTLKLLGKTSGLDDLGGLQLDVLGCSILIWIILLVILIGGISKTSKIMYFTTIFPYIILTALFIRAITLDGSYDGIYYFLVPEWKKLLSYNVWIEAAIQVTFSASLGACISTLSSYNKFHHNFVRDGTMILIMDCVASLFCGLTVFMILGFMAKKLDVPIDSVIKSDVGLAFIAIPEAGSLMPFPQFWTGSFFFVVLLLGLDSAITQLETVITGLFEIVPNHNKMIVGITCLFGVSCSVPFTCGAGIYMVDLINNFVPLWVALTFIFIERIIVVFLYKIKNLLKLFDEILETDYSTSKTKVKLATLLITISFAIITILWFTSFVYFKIPKSGDYEFPFWAKVLGLILSFIPFIPIPIMAIHEIHKSKIKNIKGLGRLFKPIESWADNGKNV